MVDLLFRETKCLSTTGNYFGRENEVISNENEVISNKKWSYF